MTLAVEDEQVSLAISVGMWAALLFSGGVLVSSSLKYVIDHKHISSFPVSVRDAYWLFVVDRLLPCAIASAVILWPLFVVFRVNAATWILVIIYVLLLTALEVIIRSTDLFEPSKRAFGIVPQGSTVLVILATASYLFSVVMHNIGLTEPIASDTPVNIAQFTDAFYGVVASVLHYLLPGVVTELFHEALLKRQFSSLWFSLFVIEGIVLVLASYFIFRRAATEYRLLSAPAHDFKAVISQSEVSGGPKRPMLIPPMFWLVYLPESPLREITAALGTANASPKRALQGCFAALVGLAAIRIMIGFVPASDIVFCFFATTVVFTLIGALIGTLGSSGVLKTHTLQSPVSREKFLLGYSLNALSSYFYIAFVPILVLSRMPLGITLYIAVIAFSILLANLPNGYISVILSGYADYSLESQLGIRRGFSALGSIKVMLLFALFQLPLIPLHVPVFRLLALIDSPNTLPCSPLYLLGCVVYALLYFYFGSKFAAWLLTKRELWYIEKALYRRG